MWLSPFMVTNDVRDEDERDLNQGDWSRLKSEWAIWQQAEARSRRSGHVVWEAKQSWRVYSEGIHALWKH